MSHVKFFHLTWPGTVTRCKKVQSHQNNVTKQEVPEEPKQKMELHETEVSRCDGATSTTLTLYQCKSKQNVAILPTSRCCSFKQWKSKKETRLSIVVVRWHQSGRWRKWSNDPMKQEIEGDTCKCFMMIDVVFTNSRAICKFVCHNNIRRWWQMHKVAEELTGNVVSEKRPAEEFFGLKLQHLTCGQTTVHVPCYFKMHKSHFWDFSKL